MVISPEINLGAALGTIGICSGIGAIISSIALGFSLSLSWGNKAAQVLYVLCILAIPLFLISLVDVLVVVLS